MGVETEHKIHRLYTDVRECSGNLWYYVVRGIMLLLWHVRNAKHGKPLPPARREPIPVIDEDEDLLLLFWMLIHEQDRHYSESR